METEPEGGGVIQLAGCRIAVSESSDSASNVLSVEHGERGTRRLKCPSADSCREWLYVLREAAAVTEHSLSPPENSSSEDLFDTRRRLTATLDGLRAHGYNDADVNRFVDKTALHESETLPRALAERDEAKLESAMLREHLLILSQDQKSAAEARVETLMQKNVHGRSSAAEEAIAALEQERKEVLRLGEERQVQLQALHRRVNKLELVIQDLEADAEVRARETTDSMLKLKLENDEVCTELLRNSASATEAVQYDLALKEAQLVELVKKLEKSEHIRAQNNELHADEISKIRQTLSVANEDMRRLQSENKILKAKVAPNSLGPTSSKSLVERKVRCPCCGEVTIVEEASQLSGGQKEHEVEIERMQEEIEKLKHALSLALKAEQHSRQEAEQFSAASRQACETLQDRISSQLSQLTNAQAENAMVKAQYRFDTSKCESERRAVDQEVKVAHLICRRLYEKCTNTLREARPTGLKALKFDDCAAQGLAVLLEKLCEWIVHQMEVLRTKHAKSVAETTTVRSQLTELQAALKAEKSSAEISHRRITSELLDAQSRIAEMTGSVQQYDATCRELGTARKQLEEVIAERDRLESDLKTVFESVEGVLQEDLDDPAGMPVQDRGILKRDKGERSPKKAELAAVAAAAAARADRPRQRRVAELTASDMWARQKCISVNTSVPCAPKRVNYFKGVLTDKDLSPKCVFMSPKKEELVQEKVYETENELHKCNIGRCRRERGLSTGSIGRK